MLPLACVHASVFVLHHPMTVKLTFKKVPLVLLTNLDPSPHALAMRYAILHRTYVFTTVCVFVVTFTKTFSINEISCKFRSIKPGFNASTVRLTILDVAFILTTINVRISSFTVDPLFIKLSLILFAIWEG